MYKNSQLFTEAIKANKREIHARVTINNIVYDDTVINSIDFDGASLSGEQLSIGSTYEDTVKIQFSKVVESIAPLDRVFVEIGVKRPEFDEELKQISNVQVGRSRMGARLNLWNVMEDIEYSLLGEFYISDHVDINYNDKITSITCKDKMIFLEDAYVSQLTYPIDFRHVIVEIANLAGVEIDVTNIEELEGFDIPKIEGYSYRQALGFIAQLVAGYVYFNRKGYLQIRKLADSGYRISPDEYFSKGLSKNGIRYKVGGITCTVPNDAEPTEIFVGSKRGTQLTIENPIMTEAILQRIFDELQGVDFYPYSLNWRGNPALETGEVVTVVDLEGNELKVPNLNYRLKYNGGLIADSSADTKSRTDIVPSGRKTYQQQINSTLKKITDTATNLENAFKEAQDKITGNQGGFIVQRLNEDGKPYEFLVMDTEDINAAKNVIRLNQQGIGFSQDGYNGPFGVAITIDGQIVADYITAGTLRADLIQSGFNNIGDGFGVIITKEGLYSVSPSGEYSHVGEGGIRFFTKEKTLNGSIESSYNTTTGKTGVGIFVKPGHGFSVVRSYPDAESNVTIFQVPDDVDELRLRRPLNANGYRIEDAGIIEGHSFSVKGTKQRIANIAGGGGAYFDTQKVSLGIGDDNGVSMKVTVLPSKVEIYENLDMKLHSIQNVGNLKPFNPETGRESFFFTTSDGYANLGGGFGTNLGYHNGTSLFPILKIASTGAMVAYRDLNMNGNTITGQSDVRLKRGIRVADFDALALIDKMQFSFFEWDKENPLNKEKPEGEQFGQIAQYAPKMLQVQNGGKDHYLSIDKLLQTDLISFGLQQAHKRIKELEDKVEKLVAR